MHLIEEVVALARAIKWLRPRLIERKLTQEQCYRRLFWGVSDKYGPFVGVRMPGKPYDHPVVLRQFGSPGEAQRYMNRRIYGPSWEEQLKWWRGEFASRKDTFKCGD